MVHDLNDVLQARDSHADSQDFGLHRASQERLVSFVGGELNPQLAEFFGVKDGVLVRSVNPMTPASKAGLKAGDVVIKVNGTPVMSPREITGLVRSSRKKAFTFTVVRNTPAG